MGYRTLRQCVEDLESKGQVVRIEQPIDPNLEAAEIQRRVFQAGGPVIYFASVKGCRFPMVCNLFGTMERMRYLFRDSLESLRRLVELSADPADVLRRPRLYLQAPWWALQCRPKRVRRGPVLEKETSIDQLPQLKCWPKDGGAYITLAASLYGRSRSARPGPFQPGHVPRADLRRTVRAQRRRSGCTTRSIAALGIHHAAALRRKEKLRLNVFVGGPPAMMVAAVMPLPEGMSELRLRRPLEPPPRAA